VKNSRSHPNLKLIIRIIRNKNYKFNNYFYKILNQTIDKLYLKLKYFNRRNKIKTF
jgi:hypothetical protein